MLSERVYRLLTAYLDGELDARGREAVARLLGRSTEAQLFLQKLQKDAESLRELPRRGPDSDLAQRILLKLPAKPMRASRYAALPVQSRVPTWLGLATAAAVLFLIGLSTYFYVLSTAPQERGGSLVKGPVGAGQGGATEGLPDPAPGSASDLQNAAVVVETLGAPKPETEMSSPAAANGVLAKGKPELLGSPLPEGTASEELFAIPVPEREVFQKASVNIALIVPFGELDQERRKQQLLGELRKDRAYRLDLGCVETAPAVERMQAAFKAHGIRLVIDHVAQLRLKLQFKSETNYALYTENVTPEDVCAILKQLAHEDRKMDKPRNPPQFDAVMVNTMSPSDHRELSKLLGVDAAQLDAAPQAPASVDIHKPLSATTAEEVVKALKGQGTPRPEPGRRIAKSPERLAVLLAYNPARPRPASREVKQFLDSRTERAPGTIQMLLVLRGTRG